MTMQILLKVACPYLLRFMTRELASQLFPSETSALTILTYLD